MLVEGFGAIAGLEAEGLTGRNLGELLPQAAGLPRKNERRLGAQLFDDLGGEVGGRPVRLLSRWIGAPG